MLFGAAAVIPANADGEETVPDKVLDCGDYEVEVDGVIDVNLKFCSLYDVEGYTVERALKEGISIIIEGVHIVPGFIKEDLIRKSNVILFTLIVRDENTHKSRFYSRCRQPWVKRSLDNYLSNFHLIRKTQSFMIDQAIKHNSKIIDNVDVTYTIDIMVNDIIEKYGGSYDVKQESKRNNDN